MGFRMIMISACLAGVRCRFDGASKPNEKVIELVRQGKAVLVCPEQLGGMPTPRVPSEIVGKKVMSKEGKDVTANFILGAEEALKIAKMYGCKEAILKQKSPSCGSGVIFDGTFSKKKIKGDGMFARLLKKNGIKVRTEEDI